MAIFVAGGTGFIASGFGIDWFDHHDETLINLRTAIALKTLAHCASMTNVLLSIIDRPQRSGPALLSD